MRPTPWSCDILFTSSYLHGHAPRVHVHSAHLLDSPLVHGPSGLLSPLALEHLDQLVAQGSGGLPTASIVVDFVAMLADTPPQLLPPALERCLVNEEACWRAWRCDR